MNASTSPTRPSRSRRLVSVLVALALSAGTLGLVATPAEAQERASRALSAAELPALIANAKGVALAAAADGTILDPAQTTFTAVAGVDTSTAVAVETSELPQTVSVSDLRLRYTITAAPDSGELILTAGEADGDRAAWKAGDALGMDGAGAARLNWTFSTPGSYTVRVVAAFAVTQAGGADAEVEAGDETEPSTSSTEAEAESTVTSSTLQADYTFTVTAAPDAVSTEASEPADQTASMKTESIGTASIEAADVSEDLTVLSVGSVALNVLLSASEAATPGTFDTATGGVLDKTSPTGAYADQVWHAATETVIHVGATEYQAGSNTWSTAQAVDDVVSYTNGDDARLLLGLDQASAVGGVNRAFNSDVVSLGGHATLTGVSGATGRVTVTGAIDPNDSVPGVIWDSSTLDQAGSQTTVTYGKGAKSWFQGWTFTEAGRYCITVEQSIDSKTNGTVAASVTYTFYVGDLPDTLSICAQETGGQDGDDPDTEDVTTIDSGHTDVRIYLNENQLDLAMGRGDGNGLVLHDFADILIARTPESRAVPAVTDSEDLTAIGPVGTEYWYFPTSGGTEDWVWPGVSTELLSASDLSSSMILTLADYAVDGVRQPDDADVVVMGSTGSPTSASDTYFSSRLGLPQSIDLSANIHAHPLWAFTKQGVYCLALTATARLADGHWSSASGVLTMVVGDIDASTVTPCERQDIDWVATASKATPEVTQSDVFTATAGDVQLGLFAAADSLDVRAQTSRDGGVAATARDADDVLIDSNSATGAGLWRVYGRPSTALAGDISYPGLFIDASGVLASQLAPDSGITMTLGNVQGPGELALTSTRYSSRVPILDSSDGGSTSHTFAPLARLTSLWWDFTAPGVYCVPLTWTAPLASGGEGSASTTLTFVVGSDEPASADYVDRTGLTTCANGQQATAPDGEGDGTDEGEGPVWDVPNGTVNDAGATILNSGHVDIASLLEAGELVTKIKDTTESSSDPVWRAPESTVLQLLPDAETAVPSSSTYSFLGSAGSRLWQVSETQQAGLLWPGWSTESIATTATTTGVTWTLTDIEGPGEFALYTSSPAELGAVDVRFNTRDGVTSADSFTIPKDVHAHGSWAFSAEGAYCLAFTRSTTLASGTAVRDNFTLTVAVGKTDAQTLDPGACFAVDSGQPTQTDTTAISLDSLVESNSGGMVITSGAEALTAGQLVTVQVGSLHAGKWVSVWLDENAWLGWAQVSSLGFVQIRLPATATAGDHKLVVEHRDGTLLGWVAMSIAEADSSTGEDDNSDDDDSTTSATIGKSACIKGAMVLAAGHIDYASRLVKGKLESLIGDETSGKKVYRHPSSTVLWLKPSSLVTLPSGYSQIGAEGSKVYQIPQTQNSKLVWLGWNTEALNASNASGTLTWKINSISGPGSVKVYLNGAFGGVQQVVFNNGGSYQIPLGVHAHANWAFSAKGIYRIRSTQSVTLADGSRSSDTATLTIVVGDVDPATAITGSASGCGTVDAASDDPSLLSATQVMATAAVLTPTVSGEDTAAAPGTDSAASSTSPIGSAAGHNSSVALLMNILGSLLLTGATGLAAVWGLRRRSLADFRR